MADGLVRRAVLDRLAATPFGSLGRRAVVDDVARVLAADGVLAPAAVERVRREGSAMVAERLLGPAGEGMWRLTDAGRRAPGGYRRGRGRPCRAAAPPLGGAGTRV